MSLSRRGLLAAIPAVALAGCATERPLRVAVVWSGDELRHFLDVVKDYAGRPVSVYSAGDNIGALLRGPAEDVIPDAAVIPRLGLLFDPVIQPRLRPWAHEQPEFWRRLVTPEGGQGQLGAWFKIAHKSLVWHRAGELPQDLDHWQPGPGSLSIGAADGWVLSDWFENVLLAYAPEVYRGLFPPEKTGNPAWWGVSRLREALERLGTIWQGAFPREQARRALTMQFHDSILDVFVYRTARLVAAPDFALPVIERYAGKGAAQHFPFPSYAGNPPPLVVGGDVAVAMNEGALDFVKWLTGPGDAGRSGALREWVGQGGFLTPFPLPVPGLLRGTADELRAAVNGHYDLSDRLLGSLEGGDGRGLWRILTELFSDVTVAAVDPGTAAAKAQEKLVTGSAEGAL
ncbi:hypothetical protein ACFLIM_38685 [Nonomuraea sp. M3C6]|uniref:Alpha-glucoside transport system substrate-binding protein n=1 Tax=Nonomuraea marmarensis TaxID=3351344 RepID=A0ABW7AP30_9ACTN